MSDELLQPSAEDPGRDYQRDRWAASLAIVACIALYVVLPSALVIKPSWLIPTLEVLVLIPLLWVRHRNELPPDWARKVAIGLLGLISLSNVISIGLLVHSLLTPGGGGTTGRSLVVSAALIWVTNVIAFSLWFWETDRGGPLVRSTSHERWPDFQFPQMENPKLAQPAWRPRFLDYLYVALTNAAAFSPTDAMPLTVRAKMLMSVESLASMVTVLVVAARAVNILK